MDMKQMLKDELSAKGALQLSTEAGACILFSALVFGALFLINIQQGG